LEGFMGSGVEALEKVVLGRDKTGILVLERMVALVVSPRGRRRA
jgi:hypothetical protein